MLVVAGQYTDLGGGVGAKVLGTARELLGLNVVQALFLAILGNTLLCLGVWLTYSARTTTDRILALTPPVVAFYAMGLEHAIAVMFYLPCAALIQLFDATGAASLADAPVELSTSGFLGVLLPVTLGNVIGGGVLVALVYWFVYLRPTLKQR